MEASDSTGRTVSLVVPAKPDYVVLARLALSAVCRLSPLAPEEVADLKLAITEASNWLMGGERRHQARDDDDGGVGRPLIEEVNELAAELKGLKVLHLSATAFGGGVSEILYTLVPLMRDVGIEAEWQVIIGREEFFNATKLMHNALQGNPLDLSPSEWKTYEEYNEMNARQLSGGWDVIIVHDPQPAAIRREVPDKAKTWIWRCHID